jgi:glutaredoxin-like protein
MSLISSADQARLRDDFSRMTKRVRLLFFTQTFGCDTCLQARAIVDELPALSPLITIEEVNVVLDKEKAATYGIDRTPAIALTSLDASGLETDTRIRFLGTPSGYEFVALVRAVVLAGGGESILSEAARQRLAGIDKPMTMRVFSTPTCPYCPRAVALAHEIALASPYVTSYAIEATEYPDLARQYHVTGVPKTVVDERIEIMGAVPEDEFVSQTLLAAETAGGNA